MDEGLDTRLPGAVLFCCNFNRVRSPMAEALLKRHAGDRIFVDSCGLRRRPSGPDEEEPDIDPLAAEVMRELGVDLSRHRSKTFAALEDNSFDLIISLTPEAQHQAVELTRGFATQLEYWPTVDPTIIEGSREHRLEAYRQVRDSLARRITARLPI